MIYEEAKYVSQMGSQASAVVLRLCLTPIGHLPTHPTNGDNVLVDTLATLDPELNVSPLFRLHAAKSARGHLSSQVEALLWSDEGYAYARVTEGQQGDLFFARVDNGRRLYAALDQGEINQANLASFLPQVDGMRLAAGETAAEVWLPDASQFMLTSP